MYSILKWWDINNTCNYGFRCINCRCADGGGGNGAFGDGGGGGEVIYIQNYSIQGGNYSIQCGIVFTTIANRQSRLNTLAGDIIKANGRGDGGSFSTSISVNRRYPPKAYNTLSAFTLP